MTREEFFDWVQAQDTRFEFDGFAPVAMTGGNINHSQITQNILFSLRSRLRGSPCRALGPDVGLRLSAMPSATRMRSSPATRCAAWP